MSTSTIGNKELRSKIRSGYVYGIGVFFIIPLIIIVVAALTGQPVTINGEPSTWWKVLPLMLITFPLTIFMQAFMFSYLVTFGLWIKSKVKTK